MSEVKTCSTCAHWGAVDPDLREIPGVRQCNATPEYWEATDWGGPPDYARTLKPEHAQAKAFVQDGSDYMAALFTMADFGCVMHKEKP